MRRLKDVARPRIPRSFHGHFRGKHTVPQPPVPHPVPLSPAKEPAMHRPYALEPLDAASLPEATDLCASALAHLPGYSSAAEPLPPAKRLPFIRFVFAFRLGTMLAGTARAVVLRDPGTGRVVGTGSCRFDSGFDMAAPTAEFLAEWEREYGADHMTHVGGVAALTESYSKEYCPGAKAHVQMMATAEGYRGKGIAGAVMEDLLAWAVEQARTAGMGRLRVDLDCDASLVKFYERFEFVLKGRGKFWEGTKHEMELNFMCLDLDVAHG
ncbi:acyl-CoA N-acyltransferase [Hyaloraphidium curvatum]|nr:acyl-CoA N-acyltransferase [Hyaloraphidium curvatum]